jgi:hypothetical protein
MDFVNHTPFPALSFEGLDQEGQSFHVLVLRQTLSFAKGSLEYADIQGPLCFADEPFDGESMGGLRQESDICHYKPRCDVIVNATAHAPDRGQAKTSFEARLRISREHVAGDSEVLIDKELVITGPRSLVKKLAIVRVAQAVARWATLGLVTPNPWRLTKPGIIGTVPLRPNVAFGGECRINAGDPAARRVPRKEKMSEEEVNAHPDRAASPAQRPVLHRVWQANPRGNGFAEQAFVMATRATVFAAPQVEQPAGRFTAKLFWDVLRGKDDKDTTSVQRKLEQASFGAVSKLSPQRVALCGTIDERFVRSDRALPEDFDFAYWNAAQADQQIEFLRGGETIELVNLCSADTAGAQTERDGKVTLRLELPTPECFALCRFEDGEIRPQALAIDTVVIEPEDCTVSVVWRTVLLKDADKPLRVWEARIRSSEARAEAIATRELVRSKATDDEPVVGAAI